MWTKCTVQMKKGNIFLKRMPCSTKQYHTPGILPTKPWFFTVEVYKRTLMDLCSFPEPKLKFSNRGKSTRVDFYLSWRTLIWWMSSMSIYDSLGPTWHVPYKSTEVTLRYQVPFLNKSLSEVLESLRWNRMHMNTSVMLDGIKVGTHCWPLHLLNVSSGKTALVMCATWVLALSCMSTNSGPTPYAATNTCCTSI